LQPGLNPDASCRWMQQEYVSNGVRHAGTFPQRRDGSDLEPCTTRLRKDGQPRHYSQHGKNYIGRTRLDSYSLRTESARGTRPLVSSSSFDTAASRSRS